MTNTFKGVIRQGDVLLLPIIPTKVSGKKLSHLTLAQGEVTGHSHRISRGQAELYERNGTLYLKVLSQTAILNHEEHRSLEIPHGNWMIKIQREYQPVKNTVKPINPIVDVNNSSSVNHTPPTVKKTQPQPPSQSYINQDELLDLQSQELHELAAQIDANYWEKLVNDAEKRKEYLDRIQNKKTELELREEDDQPKKPVRKKIKYLDYSKSEQIKLNSYPNVTNTPSTRVSEPLLPELFSHLKGLAEMKIIDLPQKPKTPENSSPKVSPSPRKLRSPQPQNWRSVVD
jgi:hypothetical protein